MNRRISIIVLLLTLFGVYASATAPQQLPAELSDEAFWNLVTGFSEAGGNFPSHNFVSNESTFQYVIPTLLQNTTRGGAYLGVGPDQNFTYIVAVHPQIAFIFDIRRQNMLQHLMYKALIEISSDRADFLSRLFSRRRPSGIGADSSAQELFAAYSEVPREADLVIETLGAVRNQLSEEHGFPLTLADETGIHFILNAFYFGPDLTYRGPSTVSNVGIRRMPTYAELMIETDEEGITRSYLASEENFRTLQDLEKKNLIVPVVGDFAGEKAIRMVADYLKQHDTVVTAFYLSNVEQYLFEQGNDWRKFYENVATLPLDSSSTFIRSWFNGGGSLVGTRGARSVSLLSSIQDFLKAYNAGGLRRYRDVFYLSN
jgi:hypothetical protein